jgi:tetratricopeptide (TPR) repeat protein
MTQAQEKLQLGLERLHKADRDPDLLGLALLSFHGALEDHFRDVLESTSALPSEQRARVQDSRQVQWRELVDLMQQYHNLNDRHKNWILSINRLRQGAGHGGRFTGTRAEVDKYGEFVRTQMNGVMSSRPIVSQRQPASRSTTKRSTNSIPYVIPNRSNTRSSKSRSLSKWTVSKILKLAIISIVATLFLSIFVGGFAAFFATIVTLFARSIIIYASDNRLNESTAHHNNALRQEKFEDYQGALTSYNLAIKLEPDCAITYNNRGLIKELKLQDYQGALTDYDRAIKLDPDYAIAYQNRGYLKHKKFQDYQGALADYNVAIQLNPQCVIAYNNRGLLKHEKLQNYQAALADYDRAIKLDPDYAIAYNNRGSLKEREFQDNRGALADYDIAIKLDPDYAIAYNNRGSLKERELQNYQAALADYNQAIELDPNQPVYYHNRSNLKNDKLSDRTGAIDDMKQAALLYQKQGDEKDYEESLAYLKEWGYQ